MTYKVTKAIRDLQDNKRYYRAGDTFPFKGVEVSEERLAELVDKGVLKRETELSDLTVKELKELAQTRDIEGYSDLKKAELIELLGE